MKKSPVVYSNSGGAPGNNKRLQIMPPSKPSTAANTLSPITVLAVGALLLWMIKR